MGEAFGEVVAEGGFAFEAAARVAGDLGDQGRAKDDVVAVVAEMRSRPWEFQASYQSAANASIWGWLSILGRHRAPSGVAGLA